MMKFRIERDTMGEVRVPADRLWGAQTQRSLENFTAGGQLMPVELIHALAVAKKAAAMANVHCGVMSEERGKLIAAVCDEIEQGLLDDHFPLVIWQTGSGTQTNMNMNEVISNRAHILSGGIPGEGKPQLHPNDDVNMSQSTNDLFPTAMHIACYRIIDRHTIPALQELHRALEVKADEFSNIVKTGRTHMMDAAPLTLGQEFSGYVTQVVNGIRALRQSLNHLSELAIGGTAVGTGLNAPDGFAAKAVALIAEYTDMPFVPAPNKFEALAANDALVEVSSALKLNAVILMKLAQDIRLLASGPNSGIGELILPANEPGSSIMPGKVNPTQAEALAMICAQVIANDMAVTIGGMSGNLELNVFKPLIIANLLHSARLMADGSSSFSRRCIQGLQPNLKRIAVHLENSLMLATALNTAIGYDKATEAVKKAQNEEISLRQAVVSLGYLTELQFDNITDVKNFIKK